jgi:hypothetical protein
LLISIIIIIISQALTIGITEHGTPYYGQHGYKLSCNVTDIDTDQLSIDYQWTKVNASLQTRINQTNNRELSFPSPLRLSDAGEYVCNVTVSRYGENTTAENVHTLHIQS